MTSTVYSNLITIIVSNADMSAANTQAALVRNDPADGMSFTDNLDDGKGGDYSIVGPTPCTPACVDNIVNNMVPNIDSAVYYVQDQASGNLTATNSDSAQDSIGSPWSLADTLEDSGKHQKQGGE